jgi:hypothetical protein
MRIAVLISGEYRTFKHCRKSMTFLNESDVDVYFSTWDETVYTSKKIQLDHRETVTTDQIVADLGSEPKGIVIEESNSFKETKYNSKMIHKWVTGFKMIKESGVQYDYVIVTRPDLFFANVVSLSNIANYKYALGTVWTHSLSDGKMADIVLVSSWEIMSSIIGDISVELWNKSTEYDWHIWWHDYCKSKIDNIIGCEEFDKCTFYRYMTASDNFTDIIAAQHDWRDLRLLHESDLYGRKFSLNHWPITVVETAERKWAEGYFDKYRDNGKDNP